jgi:hypothetical protein
MRSATPLLRHALVALVTPLFVTTFAHAAPVNENTNLSGLWLDAERAAQGLMLEQIDPPSGAPDGGLPRVIVSWYTWAPAADPDPGPRWLFGVGRREGHRIQVQLQIAVAGNSPFEAQDAPAQLAEWGFAEIRVPEWSTDTRNIGVIEFAGPVGWGEGERQLAQLTTMFPSLIFHPGKA